MNKTYESEIINILIDSNGDEWFDEIKYLGSNSWEYTFYGSCDEYGEINEVEKPESYELIEILKTKDQEEVTGKRLKTFYEYLRSEIDEGERYKIIFNILSKEHTPIDPKSYILTRQDINKLCSYLDFKNVLNLEVNEIFKKIKILHRKSLVKTGRRPGWGSFQSNDPELTKLKNKLSILDKFGYLMIENIEDDK